MTFNPAKFNARLRELCDDGYIRFVSPGSYQVTFKGIAVLTACADRPQTKGRLTKPSLLLERMRTDAERARQLTFEKRTRP
jgi:hypothetical protein